MTTNAVIDSNARIMFAGQVRETLCINGFYSKDKLDAMGNIIAADSKDILGFETDENMNLIRFKLKNIPSCKFDGINKFSLTYSDQYSSIATKALITIFNNSYPELVSMFGPERVKEIYAFSGMESLSSIQRFGNCLIIHF